MPEPKEHYFKTETEIPMEIHTIEAIIRGDELEFQTSPPVFSWRKVDKGTLTLAENMEIPDAAKDLLDLGCGYGVIGIVAARNNPELKVTMIDKSKRAVQLTRKNLRLHNLKNAEVMHGDLYSPLKWIDEAGKEHIKKFDVIVSNPPYSAGKSVVVEIIKKAPEHLKEGGSLQIVGRHNKGGKMYKEEMLQVFSTLEETGRSAGYRVYIGKK
ncbi:MAG: methyltransferase [archaeon]